MKLKFSDNNIILQVFLIIALFTYSNTCFANKSDLLRQIETANLTTQAWQADFVQITTVEALGQDLQKMGRITAAKPKQFFITYITEPQKSYIYNGKNLWLHQIQSQSVISYKNPENFISNEALGFLSGLEKLSTLFMEADANEFPKFTFRNKKLKTLALVPIHENGSIEFLALGLDNKLNTEEAILWTPNGNHTHYIFKNYIKNPKLDKSLFTWTKQKGVKEFQQ